MIRPMHARSRAIRWWGLCFVLFVVVLVVAGYATAPRPPAPMSTASSPRPVVVSTYHGHTSAVFAVA